MEDRVVRLERLGPMRVAAVHAFGASPELAAMEKLRAWAGPRGLLEDRKAHRVFGHNNPPPRAPGDPYGYDFLIAIGSDVAVEGAVQVREIPRKMWATTRTRGVQNIHEAWVELFRWCEEHNLEEQGTGLEEHLSPFNIPVEEIEFRLWLPVLD